MAMFQCTLKQTCAAVEHMPGCPYFLSPDISEAKADRKNDLNQQLNMTDEELQNEIFEAEEQTIEVLRQGIVELVDSAKACYDSMDNDRVNYLTAKHVKTMFEQAQSVHLFMQLIASGTSPIQSED